MSEEQKTFQQRMKGEAANAGLGVLGTAVATTRAAQTAVDTTSKVVGNVGELSDKLVDVTGVAVDTGKVALDASRVAVDASGVAVNFLEKIADGSGEVALQGLKGSAEIISSLTTTVAAITKSPRLGLKRILAWGRNKKEKNQVEEIVKGIKETLSNFDQGDEKLKENYLALILSTNEELANQIMTSLFEAQIIFNLDKVKFKIEKLRDFFSYNERTTDQTGGNHHHKKHTRKKKKHTRKKKKHTRKKKKHTRKKKYSKKLR